MPSYDPELTSGDPYYDDFDKTKNYLKILFKPGFAVQARELTQLQTTLQTQVERFGDHVFKNGTPVLGSGLTEKNVGYVRVTNLSETNRALIDGDFVTGTGDKSNLRARIISTEAPLATGVDTFPVVFLQYLSGGGTAGDSFGLGDQIYSETQSVNFTVKSTTSDLVAPTGNALACSIDTGVFYIDGFFVYINPQTNVPYRLSTANQIESPSSGEEGTAAGASAGVRLYQYPTNRVGLQINKKIIDNIDDPTLVDPAKGSYNYSAPGADRYQVDPVFSSKVLNITTNTPSEFIDEDFVDVLRVENGKITKRYNTTQYAELEKNLARRTYDESGNYTVRPFNTTILNSLRVDKYKVDVTLTSVTGVFGVGDKVINNGVTADILDVLDRTNFVGSTAQRLIVDMESGRFSNGTITSPSGTLTGTVTNVTFMPDATGVFSQEQGGLASKLATSVSPGKAYVYGYEFETQSNTNILSDRARTDDTLIGVGLNANVGNYVVAKTNALPFTDVAIKYSGNKFDSYAFDTSNVLGASGPFRYNNLPQIDIKGKYIQVNIPYRANEAGRATIRYWAPLFATEHDAVYDNVMVIDTFESATMESSTTGLIVGNQSSGYYLPTSIDSQGGWASSQIYSPGAKVDKNLQKITFSQNYRSGINYSIAKGKDINNVAQDSSVWSNFKPDGTEAGGATCAFVRQVFLGDIDQSISDNGPSAYVRSSGIARRWIPAESLTYRSGSTLIIQSSGELSGGIQKGCGVVQQGWAGISGTTQNCSPIAYGSSITSIVNKNLFVLPVSDAYTPNGVGYNSESNFAIGDAIRQFHYGVTSSASAGGFTLGNSGGAYFYTDPNQLSESLGEVAGWVLTTDGPVLYVEPVSGIPFKKTCGLTSDTFPGCGGPDTGFDEPCSGCSIGVGCTLGFVGLIDLASTAAPSAGATPDYQFKYGVKSSYTNNQISVQEVRFASDDPGIIGDRYLDVLMGDNPSDFNGADPKPTGYTKETIVSQGVVSTNYKHGQTIVQFTFNDWTGPVLSWNGNGGFGGDPNIINKGTVVSWDNSQKRLLLQICDGFQGFQRDLGHIFGLRDTSCGMPFVGYGGNGIYSNSTVSTKDSNIVDMAGPFNVTTVNFSGYGSYIEGETGSQLLQSKSNFVPGRFYSVGEKVAQNVPGTQPTKFATGTVVNFTARNSGNSADTQDTTLLIELDSMNGPSFEVGANARAILEGTLSTTTAGFTGFVPSPTGKVTTIQNSYGLNGALFNGFLGTAGSSSDQYTETQVPVTIGRARIRQIQEQSNDAHQVSLFDVTMFDKRPGVKFFLSEIYSAYYGFAKQANRENTMQTAGGKMFDIHPTYLGKVYNPELNKLIFPVPRGDVIKSINALDYRILKSFTVDFSNSDQGQTAEISSGNSNIRFVGGYNPSQLIDGTDLNNYLMVDNDGKIMDLFSDAFQFRTNNLDAGDQGRLTITKNIGGGTGSFPSTNKFDLIAMLDVNPGETIKSSPIRLKKLTEETHIFATGDIKTSVTGRSYFELPKTDIYSLIYAYDTGVSVTADVSNIFTLDNGQRDNLYQKGRLYLANNGLTPIGSIADIANSRANLVCPLDITYRYFAHSGEGPFVSDSYVNENPTGNDIKFLFGDIPEYTSPDSGEVINLNKVIDLRPSFDGVNFSSVFIPASGQAFNISYSYFLPRIDKLVLTRDKEFKIIQGVPALDPKSPDRVVDAMELYKFYIPAYTYKSTDVISKFIENKRFTMRDIGSLERRIQQIEYYSTLSLLERQTEALFIKDANGNDRFKNGIVVDQFSGHNIGDVKSDDYNVAIDFVKQELRPPFISRSVDFDVNSISNLHRTKDNMVMSVFDSQPLTTQPLATTSVNLNPFIVTNWLGRAKLNPASDNWYDDNVDPDILVNIEGENDAWKSKGYKAFGTQWNDWKTNWIGNESVSDNILNKTGNTISRTTNVTSNRQLRTGIETRMVPERIIKEIGNRFVDLSVVPFVRSKAIAITATNLRPNTRVYAFFDGVDVNEHCTFLIGTTAYRISEADLITDSTGTIPESVKLVFTIPAGQFRSGEKLFRLTDESSNNAYQANTSAEIVYSAEGLVDTNETISVSTRKPITIRTNVNEEKIITDTDTDMFIDQSSPTNPLSQTFFISPTEHPNGVFVDKVSVFFKSKSSKLPVSLQLRPTSKGYPSSYIVYPFAEVVKDAVDVNISNNPDVASIGSATTFTFSTPVYLLPGEHAVVLSTNSDEYETYIAVMGDKQIGTQISVTEQPNLGSLYRTENAGMWEADPTADLMVQISKCKFKANGTQTITLTEEKGSGGITGEIKLDVGNLNADIINWPASRFVCKMRFTPNSPSSVSATSTEFDVSMNETFEFTRSRKINLSTSDTNNTLILNATISGTNQDVSPVLDLDRLSLIAVENIIEGAKDITPGGANYNGELDPQAKPVIDGKKPRVRYVTRQVNLADGFESKNIRVILNEYKPQNTDIQVFIKQQPAGEDAPFDNESYTQLTASTSGSFDGYREVSYTLPADLTEPMGKFVIKICMYADGAPLNTAIVPIVKELRTIALA
jgi:hypothetical protein